MISLVQLHLAVIALGFGPTGNAHCVPIDEIDVQSKVHMVLTSADTRQMTERLANFGADWSRNCLSSRRNASPAVVADLGRLLQVPVLRWMTVTMMFDVGQNLHYAENSLRS